MCLIDVGTNADVRFIQQDKTQNKNSKISVVLQSVREHSNYHAKALSNNLVTPAG